MSNLSLLFKPLKVGEVQLQNRVIMAAMTRMRCNYLDSIPNKLLEEYYSQRAGAGLILTECAKIDSRSDAFPGSAGIFNEKQVEGWKRVNEAVHKKNGKLSLQIWHSGRASHSKLQNGQTIWAPSPIAIRGPMKQIGGGDHEIPHEMTLSEIQEVIHQFEEGAQRAKEAGFDSVELHGANGYLVDQFLRSASNRRTDNYGGSVQNRTRFCLEVIDKLISVFGKGRVGIKLSPISRYNDMFDSNPIELYSFLLQQLDKKGISFIEIMNDNHPNNLFGYGYPGSREQVPNIYKQLRPHFKGVIIGNCGLTAQQAAQDIENGLYDAASFGIPFISNPDLVERFKKNIALAEADVNTFYGGNHIGYTDYPSIQ